MTSIFSAISGQFSRAIILGALLPAAVYVILAYLFVLPMVPVEWRLTRVELLDPEWKLAAVTITSVLIAGLLHVLNTSIIRLYEGYPWKDGLIGRAMAAHQERRLAQLASERLAARELKKQLEGDPARVDQLSQLQIDAANDINYSFPEAGTFILPTRLGNVIRSFENYPKRQYGISGITFWTRFATKLSASHAGAIDDAKTLFNVTINLSFLSLLLAAVMLILGCMYPIQFVSPAFTLAWIAKIAVAVLLTYLFYSAAIGRAMGWGEQVRAVFDLHRWSVLQDLGFEQKPRTLEAERKLWSAISLQIDRGDPLSGPALRYATHSVEVLPESAGLEVTRGISVPDANRVCMTTVTVRNAGTHPVRDVVLIETLPSGREYRWGSMTISGMAAQPPQLSGTNPYRVKLGALDAGAAVVVTYEAIVMEARA